MKIMTEKDEPFCQRLDNGLPVHADDPERGVWYSAGTCGYWTDDWAKLDNRNGIPCCPSCKCPGMQITARDWFDGAQKYEDAGNPSYVEFVVTMKEVCYGPGRLPFMSRYKLFAGAPKGGE